MGTITTAYYARRGAMLLPYLLLTLTSATAVGQSSTPPPTPDKSIDARRVDVITGRYYAPWPSISIGQPGAGGLNYALTENNLLHDSLFGALSSNGSNFTLTYMGVSRRWTMSGSTFMPEDGQGGSLSFDAINGEYTYRTPEGSVVIIDKHYDQEIPAIANEGRVTSVTHPTGETLTYHYETSSDCVIFGPDGQCDGSIEMIRPMGVSSSLGYLIKYEYDTNTLWWVPDRVLAINSRIDDCLPSALQCSGLTKNWPSLSFSNQTMGTYGGTITDNLGRSYIYTTGAGGITGVRLPGSASNDISVAYTNDRVSSLTVGGETWTYTYTDSGSVRTTTITDSGGHTTTIKSDLDTMRVTSRENKANAITAYQYDDSGRLTRITRPEGNYVGYQYDDRGNIREIRRVAKPGAGLADIVVTMNFPTTCSNPVTCNKPTTVSDPRGHTTNFTYDPTHGSVIRIERPAVDGVRPTTTFFYASLPAYSGFVWRRTAIRTCATSATCTNSVHETETTLSYTAGSRLPSQVSVQAGDGSGMASITTMTYNHNDDIATIDGPLTGPADTIYLRYDDLRRQVGAIGPDPDGGGALKRRATRVTFNLRGQIAASERGTVGGLSDAHWSAFAPLLKETMHYDNNGRLSRTTLMSDGLTHTVTQYSYDGEGRLECTAFRMNPALFDALPGACTASTLGSFGPDRISRTSYDMADRVNKVTTAYGTGVAADRMQGYTANGLVGWIEDGNGNRSTYEYDGFDRLAKLRYPHPTSVGTSSSSDYDGYTYDAASNVTEQRLRDGQLVTYTYDELGRLTLRNAPGSTNDRTVDYDLLGRVLSVTTSGHTNSFSYNALGQTTSATGPLGTVSYGYDSGGRRSRLTYPDGFYVAYDYDATGAMTLVRENGATSGVGVLAAYGYDDLGRRVSLTRGNGVVTTYGYDAAARLSTLTHDLPGAAGDLTVTFDRNPAGQITSRTAFNDLYAWAGQPSPEIATSVNGRNQVTSQDGRSFAHDARGNLTSDGVGTYGYDVDDRLTAAPGGATLDYDAVGRLYEADNAALAATRFLYDGSTLIAEYDASGNLLRRYVHGAGIDEPLVWYEGSDASNRRWLAADERGSVIAATNGSGGVLAAYTYDEYGIPGPGNAGRFQYTGQTWIEAVGLYHYKSRFYDPRQGRFLQADRIGYAGGMNLYAYVDGDPINLIDPLGWDDAPPCSEQNDCTLVIVRAKRPRELKFGGGGSSLRFVPLMSDIFGPWVAATTGDLRTRDDESEEEGPDEDDYECTLSSLLDSVARNTTWTIGGGIGVGGKAFGRLNVQVFHAYGGAGGNFAGHTWSYVSGGGPAVEVKFGSVRAGFSTGGGTTRWGTHYFQEQSESAFAGYSSDAGTLDYGNRLHVPFIDLGISPDFAQIWREWRCSK